LFIVDVKIASGKTGSLYTTLKSILLKRQGSGHNVLSSIQFSNSANSLCTSLGKYKIGNVYNGKFGLAFKRYALDTTNSNAYNRFVVLPAHPCVPNAETATLPIC
jgi:hypothetical protein